MDSKANIIKEISVSLLGGLREKAEGLINEKYPFVIQKISHRSYSLNQKMKIFLRDGFIDRYSGDRLIIPGMLKVLSNYYPSSFPYHKNGKMTEGHIAYWELFPTIDHIVPIAIGGLNNEENMVTTSMLNNSIKSNWTLEQMKWSLHKCGDIIQWDGLTKNFLSIVDSDKELLKDNYIKDWYNAANKCLHYT